MSSAGAAPCAVPAIHARAEASRRNGARSRGPKTTEGKARSSQNALKHGFRAQKHVVLDDEDAAEFKALEAALIEELAPQGALQSVLARRLAAAAWRLCRADRIESELLGRERRGDGDLARGVIRDGHGARVLPTLLRYRGAAMAELMRSLRALKALQAEARAAAVELPAARATIEQSAAPASIELAPDQGARKGHPHAQPIEPEGRGNPGQSDPATAVSEPAPVPALALARLQRSPQPDEPRLGLAQGEAAPGWAVGPTAPGAIAPPR
jgi:hypothetical protein